MKSPVRPSEREASAWAAVERTTGGRRARIDLDAVLDPTFEGDPSAPLADVLTALRRAIATNPGPRPSDRIFQSGLVRQELEHHALPLRDAVGITEMIDDRLVAALSAIETKAASPSSKAVRIACRWGGRADPRLSPRWHRRLLGRVTGTSDPSRRGSRSLPPVLERMFGGASARGRTWRDDTVLVGDGWIETASGRRRIREDFVTMVLGHVDSDPRVELRLVAIDRSIRLRFESVADPRLRRFWSRWRSV